MRNITRDSISAFKSNRTFHQRNTDVVVTPDGTTLLVLHGHNIARKVGDRVELSMCGHPTPTTRDRLNGVVGAGRFYQKDHTQYFDEHAIGSRDVVVLDRITGNLVEIIRR